MAQPYEQVAAFLSSKTKYRPQIGIICGSGLSGLSKSLSETETFKYEDIPGFPEATVAGHHGELVFGVIGGIETVCMRGRFHFYEGNSMDKVVLPVRVMRLMGVKLLIVTNAAGGLNPDFEVGDIMVIQDHFGGPIITGQTPLRGPNDDALGPRFPSVSDAYDPELQTFVKEAAEKLKITDKIRLNGTYCFVSGPQYESRCESRFLRSIGGDSVGMSTVPEVLAAKHSGMKVLGLSLITNKVVTKPGETHHACHEEVLAAVDASGKFVEAIVKEISRYEVLGKYLEKLPAVNYPFHADCGCSSPCGCSPCNCGSTPCKCSTTSACAGSCGANCKCGSTPCKCSTTSACAGSCGTNCKCGSTPCKCSSSGCCGGSCGSNCKCGSTPCKCGTGSTCGGSCGANCKCGSASGCCGGSNCKCSTSSSCGGSCGANCKCGTSYCHCSTSSACGGGCGANCKCPPKATTGGCCGGKKKESECCQGWVTVIGLGVLVGGLFYVLKNKSH